MPLDEASVTLILQAVSWYDYGDRYVEDLGPISDTVDNFRITLHTDHPRSGWVCNTACDMNVFCLLGTIHLHVRGGGVKVLTVGCKVSIQKGTYYRWSVHEHPAVLRVQSTPHWYVEQHVHVKN